MTTPARPTLTARTPEDLVAVVPVVLGFTPADSLVMLTFDAEHPFHARVDLPLRRDEMGELAAVLLAPATRHRVGRVVLLVYSDDTGRAAAAWRSLRDGCRDRGIDVVEALRVEPGRWFPYLGHDRRLRSTGVAYDISAHPFRVQSVLDGRITYGSRADLKATLDPLPDREGPIRDALDVLDGEVDLLTEGEWVEDLVARHLGAGSSPTDGEVARLLRGLAMLRVRDAAWSCLTRARSREAVTFWTDVLRRTPRSLRAPVATLLAWSAWQGGDGALAWCAIDRCSEVDPDYTLMLLLAQALERAVPPSAWDEHLDWRAGLDVARREAG